MPKDLSFAPGISLTLLKEARFYGEDEIGEIFIQMDKIKERPKRPRFYQFYSNDGRSVGKLLAIFYIKEYHKDKKEDFDIDLMMREFREELTRADIKVALVGLRNLAGKCKDLTVKVSLLGLTTASNKNAERPDSAIKAESPSKNEEKKSKARRDDSDKSDLDESDSDRISSEDEEDNLK